ncbi:MAG TPA: hypothetical protein VK169_09030 [Saprospiraceae bacterium]|nr:hypothetical protein [Saprospiraceae bacterium]
MNKLRVINRDTFHLVFTLNLFMKSIKNRLPQIFSRFCEHLSQNSIKSVIVENRKIYSMISDRIKLNTLSSKRYNLSFTSFSNLRTAIAAMLFISLSVVAYAQPTVLGTQLANGSYVTYDLNTVGGFKQFRLQASNSAAVSTRNWEFATGTAGATNYSTNWRPYTTGNTLSANTFIPTSFANGAKYNTSFGGQSGLLPAITNGNYYTFNVSNNATADNVMQLMETTYNPVSISTTTQNPAGANVLTSQSPVITVTTASAPAMGENVFVRYTTDAFVSSTLVQLSFTGATGTATIPALPSGTVVAYYIYSSNKTLAQINSDVTSNGQPAHDMATLNLNNNGGSNYNYTVTSNNVLVTSTGGTMSATYATLATAVSAVNGGTHTGTIVCTVNDGYTETAPTGGFSITATGTVSNTITFTRSNSGGSRPVFTAFLNPPAGQRNDAVFKIIGGDYITIDGFAIQENSGNTTGGAIGVQRMTEMGVGIFAVSATNGAQNNTIQNCTITLGTGGAYQNAIGIFASSSSAQDNAAQVATSTAGTNSNNKIYGNTISGVAYGIYVICPGITTTLFETGWDIGGTAIGTANTITFGNATNSDLGYTSFSGTLPAGIYFRNGAGNSVRFNTITSNNLAYVQSAGLAGVVYQNTAPSGVTFISTISNNTINLTNTGTTAITGVDFGYGISTGTIIGSTNNITINQTASAANSSAIIALKANYTSATNTCSSNTVVINQTASSGALSSVTTGVTLAGSATTITANSNDITINQTGSGTGTITGARTALSVAGPASTINVLSNTILINQTTSVATGITTGAIIGINATAATTTLNIGSNSNANTITIKQGFTGAGTYGTNAVTYVDLGFVAHGTINVVSNNFNTTGSTIRSTGTLNVVAMGTTEPSGLNTIKSNTVNIDRIATSGNINFFNQSSGSPSNPSDTISSNTITLTNLATSGTVIGIQQLGGPSTSSGTNKSICNNTISVSGTNTGTVTGISFGYANANVRGNSITVSSASSTVNGILANNTGASACTISGNTFSLSSSSTSGTSMVAIAAGATGPHQIYSNVFNALNYTGILTTGPSVSAISLSAGTGNNINDNVITTISVGAATSSGSPTIDGILISGGTSVNVFKNKIYGITTAATGISTIVNGIRISGGTTNNVYNNLIGNLTATAASSTNAVRGIAITSTTATSTNNVYYNTVYLNATSSGTNFGTSGIFHTASATTTTAVLNLRNNIIVNNSIPNGSGLVVAFRRSSGVANTLANYAATSNNNVFFSGTPGASNLIYSDGTSNAQTLASYKSGVFTAGTIAPRDALSVSEDPTFLSTSGSSANFLHINSAVPTQIESGGTLVAGITDDFDGDTRNVTTPDIGADEGTFILADLSGPVITYTPLGNGCAPGVDQTLTATITDPSGVPTSGAGLPVLYYKINAGTFTAVPGTSIGTNQYTFTFGSATTMAGDVVSYYIAAQDNAGTPNVTVFPSTGSSGLTANPPAASTSPTNPNSWTVTGTLSGSYNVGSGQTYTTITAAIADYNSKCLSGPVIFSLTDASYTETAAMIINANSYANAVNTLTIKPTLANTTIDVTGGSSTAIFILNGADYITIDGSTGSTSNTVCPASAASRDLTITNTNSGTTSAVVWLQTTTGSDASTNNKIQNCNIVGSSPVSTLIGIGSGGAVINSTSLGNSNNNNSYVNNNISKVQFALYSQGASSGNKNSGTIINQNTVNTASPNNVSKCGVYVGFENNLTISGNVISNVSGASSTYAWGIGLGLNNLTTTSTTGNEVTNALVTHNMIGTIRAASTYGVGGIQIASAASGTNLLANNMIADAFTNGTSSDIGAGIYVGGGNGTTQIYYNTIQMASTLTGGAFYNFGIAINGSNPVIDLRNNIVTNTGSNGANNNRAIGLAYNTFSNLTSNNNNFFVSGTNSGIGQTGSLSNSGFTLSTTIANWRTNTGKDMASVNVAPVFISANDLHLNTTSNNMLNGIGAPVSVTADIDCDPRNMTTPDLGADEFDAPVCLTAVGGTASGNATFCGSGTPVITASGYSVNDGSGYQWVFSTDINDYPNGGSNVMGQTNPATLSTGVVTNTTYYWLRVTCATNSSTDHSTMVTISVNPLPTMVTVTGGGIICGASTILTATNGADGTIYFQGTTTGGTSTAVPSTSETITTNGTYYFRAQSDLGCWGLEGSTALSLVIAPAANGVTICVGGTGNLTSSHSCTPTFVNSAGTISGTWTGATDLQATRLTGGANTTTCSFGGSVRNYVAIPIQVTVTGNYVFEMNNNAAFDGMGYLVSGNFTPGSCATGTFIRGDDDSGPNDEPKLGDPAVGAGALTLSAGVTYTLISTTYSNGSGTYSGPFSWTGTPPSMGAQILVGSPSVIQWYDAATNGNLLGTGASFSPVGVPNSPLPDSNTPGTTTFYAACSGAPDCRTAVNFVINPNYEIVATSGANGTVTPLGSTSLSCDGTGDQTFTITPAPGYAISDLIVDGASNTVLTTGSYAVGGTFDFINVTSNRTISATFVLTCNAPTISVQPLAIQTLCQNATPTDLVVTATGDGLMYQWYSDTDNTGNDGTMIGSATNATYTPPTGTAGTYYYYCVVTGTCAPAATSNYAVVFVNVLTAIPTMDITTATCSAAGTATISNYDVDNMYTFDPLGPTVGAGGVISNMTAGTAYTVTATNGIGCTSTVSASFSVAAQLLGPFAPMAGSNSPICSGATLNLTSSASGTAPFTYNWTGPDGFNAMVQNPSIPAATAAASGTYNLTVTNSCGNTSIDVNIIINVGPSSLNYTSNTVSYCLNTAIATNSPTFTGSPATSYSVSPPLPAGLNFNTSTGEITGTPTVATAATDYTVTVTNICGSTTRVVNIQVNESPTAGTCKIDDLCQTNSGTITVQASGGTAPYNVTWTPAHGTPSSGQSIPLSGGTLAINGLHGGVTYIFTITDANGCSVQ